MFTFFGLLKSMKRHWTEPLMKVERMKERKLSTAASPVNLETIFFFAIDGTYIKSLVS